jgi:hypothetical protein
MTITVAMLQPAGFTGTFIAESGNSYTPNSLGIIAAAPGDVLDAEDAGFTSIGFGNQYIGHLLGANFNVTTDQAIPLFIPSLARFRVTKITAENTSVNGMSTAAGGIYPAASKGGTALVASSQAYTGLTNANTALDLTLATVSAIQPAGTSLYLSLTTAQGAAATADLYVFGDVYI